MGRLFQRTEKNVAAHLFIVGKCRSVMIRKGRRLKGSYLEADFGARVSYNNTFPAFLRQQGDHNRRRNRETGWMAGRSPLCFSRLLCWNEEKMTTVKRAPLSRTRYVRARHSAVAARAMIFILGYLGLSGRVPSGNALDPPRTKLGSSLATHGGRWL